MPLFFPIATFSTPFVGYSH